MMLGTVLGVGEYLDRLSAELARLSQDDVRCLADLIFGAYRDGKTLFLIGNGGSACTASHLAEDLGKKLLEQYP